MEPAAKGNFFLHWVNTQHSNALIKGIVSSHALTVSLVFMIIVAAVICFYLIRRLDRTDPDVNLPIEFNPYKEPYFPSIVELMVVSAYGGQRFDVQTLFSRTAKVSYDIMGNTGSWQEMQVHVSELPIA